MGARLSKERFNDLLAVWSKDYIVSAPALFKGAGSFSDTDQIRYKGVKTFEEIVFGEKSTFSHKEVLLPITQQLFYFTEDETKEAKQNEDNYIVFLRSCDMHSVKRLDEMYLRNGFEDIYYKKFREKTKFIVMGCKTSFENCFCVDMGTNKPVDHDGYIHAENDSVYIDIIDQDLLQGFTLSADENQTVTHQFVEETQTRVNLPKNVDISVAKSDMWDEYQIRCIGCGRCNFVCPTCTCFSMQDVAYTDNGKNGERRRVWASCHMDGFTDMAGGHSFRENKGQRMRFKVLHKVYDYEKRFGYHMCTGCGRCDDVCPEYISFANAINKLDGAMANLPTEAKEVN